MIRSHLVLRACRRLVLSGSALLVPLRPSAADRPMESVTLFQVRNRAGTEHLVVGRPAADGAAEPAFTALPHRHWWPGLVPVFSVDRTNRLELRRRPPAGQENFVDPLFFALPPTDEPEAARIAGRWKCTGTRGAVREARFEWELTAEGDQVAGRFDQNTDYRFAFINGGSFQTNRLELRVGYNNDSFILNGEWREGAMRGTWRRTDDTEGGEWDAVRVTLPTVPTPAGDPVPLFEWSREGDPFRRYRLEGEAAGDGWVRAARPLCRVWLVESKPAASGK